MSEGPSDRWTTGWPGAILAALAILGLYLFLASQTSIRDRDEGWYCRAAAEMVASGNYLYPTYNDAPFLEKPILMYWLMTLAMRAMGPTELACRFFSALGISASCLLTWWIGRRLFDARTGMWAMALTATSLMALVVGPMALTDSILLALLFGAMASFASAIRRGASPWQLAALALTTGLAMLAKGPMGLAPLAMIGTALWLGRKSLHLGWRYFLLASGAVLLGSAMFFTWAILANRATGGQYFHSGLGVHVIGRLSTPMQGHGGVAWKYLLFLPFYVPVVLVGFFPWVLHLGGAASAFLGRRLGDPGGSVFIAAAILPLAIGVTLMATKLPHYILPTWLGLSMAAAATIEAWRTGRLSDRDRLWLRRGVWPFGVLGGAGGLAMIIGPWLVSLPGLRASCAIAGAMILAMTAGGIWTHLVRGPEASARLLVCGMVALATVFTLLISPRIEEIKGVPRLAASVKAAIPAGAPVATYGFDEPSLHFYLARHLTALDRQGPDGALAWLATEADGAIILTAENLEKLESMGYHPPLQAIIASQGTINFGKLGWVDLLAIRRGG